MKWSSTEEWKLPTSEGLRTTFFPIRRYPENIVEIERRLLDGDKSPTPKPGAAAPARTLQLDGIRGRIQAILERKGQAIVYGPPGTGKTYWARQTARDLAGIGGFGRPFTELGLTSAPQWKGRTKRPDWSAGAPFTRPTGTKISLRDFVLK